MILENFVNNIKLQNVEASSAMIKTSDSVKLLSIINGRKFIFDIIYQSREKHPLSFMPEVVTIAYSQHLRSRIHYTV